jgi:hypothetical protein
LSAVPTLASTTAVDLAGRFGLPQFAGVEEGVGENRLPGGGDAAGRAAGAWSMRPVLSRARPSAGAVVAATAAVAGR